jgi:hypothetical protein
MRHAFAIVVGLFIGSLALGAEPVRSGLQPGERVTTIFEPLNVTGEFAGELHCLVCENGPNPVAMVFAREISEPLIQLIAKLDAATGKHRDQQLGSFVVLLSDQSDVQGKLQQIAKQKSLAHTVLSIDAPRGPDGFNVAADADVTVVLYEDFDVKANHAFRKGELTEKSTDAIVADLPKILAK